MSPPRLSIILPTFNRAASLRIALHALLRQTAARSTYELVVVDNNSSDDTPHVLAEFTDERVRTIRERRQGLSFARNTGVSAARGDLIAFVDDDVDAAPDWVETLIAAFDAEPQVDGIGGRVLPAWPGSPPRWLGREHWAPLALQDHGAGRRIFSAREPIGLIGANVAFRRDVFTRIGGFSPHVQRVKDGVGSIEDREFLTRLYASGGSMLYHPPLVVTARIQPERCRRAYHRRWHRGHGYFHARMRGDHMERSRASLGGVPGHLLRSAARDFLKLPLYAVTNRERAFRAELRLRFFVGFVTARLGGDERPGAASGLAVSAARRAGEASNGTPDVSVIIPCYNQGHYLTQAVRSIERDAHAVEVIVVDDGSADATSVVARALPEVRLVRQENQGLAAARNRGLREAQGRFIVFLDADDCLLPGALDTGVRTLESRPECVMAFGRCVMIGPEGDARPTAEQPLIAADHHAELLRRNPIWMPAMAMFRRHAVVAAGGFRTGFDGAADYDLYLRMSRHSQIHDHGTVVAAYRQHGQNMSDNAAQMLRDTYAVMRRNRPTGDEQLLAAWRQGCRVWREFYGARLLRECRAARRERRWGAAVRKAILLAAWCPRLAGRECWKKLRLHIRPAAAEAPTSR